MIVPGFVSQRPARDEREEAFRKERGSRIPVRRLGEWWELGPLAVIGELNFVDMLPKTRSGKIMRRVFKAVVLDQDPGDITTIEDEGSVEEARQAWQRMKASIGGE